MTKGKRVRFKSAEELYQKYREMYNPYIGKQAVYLRPDEIYQNDRVREVEIVKIYPRFLLVKYKPKHPWVKTDLYTCIQYTSLATGRERLSIREIIEVDAIV